MPRGRKSIDNYDPASAENMNKRILELLEELTDSKYAGHFPGHPSLQGIEAYEQFASNFFTAFFDLQATVEDLITEGDKVVVRQTWCGTHTGNFEGIAPTGKQVTFTSIEIYHFTNGRLVEEWVELDRFGILQQLGVIKFT